MGARVGTAEQDVLVLPGPLPQRPGVRVVVGGHGPQHRTQLVGGADLDEAVERVLAALGGDVAYDAPAEALVRRAVRVADDVPAEVGETPEDACLLAVGTAQHLGADGVVAEPLDPFGDGEERISPQPGMRLRAQKVPSDMFMGVRIGMVRATIRPPARRASSLGTSWRGTRSGTAASTVRTFQLRGRPAAAVMSTRRSISSSENWSRQPATIASSWVPSCSPTARERARSSSGSACREATGLPSPSECVAD